MLGASLGTPGDVHSLEDADYAYYGTEEGGWLGYQATGAGDVDGDGDLDVFVSNYTNWSPAWLEATPSAPIAPANDSL